MRFKYFFTNDQTSQLDSQIDAIMDEMTSVGPGSEEYPKLLEMLNKLYEMKAKDRRAPVSKDTIAIIGGNLLLGLIVVGFERTHVATSKAWGMMVRPKGPGIG